MEDEWDDDVLHAEVQMLEARHASSAKAAKKRDRVSASLATKAKRRKTQEPQGPGADGGVTVQTVAASIPAPLSLPMPPGGVIRVGTECSGMESVSMALKNLGILGRCSLEFCCEIDKWCRNFIWQNHPPKIMLNDITCRDPATTPPCDLYVAGFPCQPFSRAGLMEGTEDSKGRGNIFEHVLSYLQVHRPRAVILENVEGLCAKRFADTLNGMLQSLMDIKCIDGQPYYLVSKRVVDTSAWGLPQKRKRLYIICMSRRAIDKHKPFMWPRRSAASTSRHIDDILQSRRGGPAELKALGPKCSAKLVAYLDTLRARGHDPDVDTWIINVFGGYQPHGMKNVCPCLTRGRAGSGGHWVSTRRRLLTIDEMLTLQGIPADVHRKGISNRQVGYMIGNAMSVNVLERLLLRLLPGVGLLPERPRDRWA